MFVALSRRERIDLINRQRLGITSRCSFLAPDLKTLATVVNQTLVLNNR